MYIKTLSVTVLTAFLTVTGARAAAVGSGVLPDLDAVARYLESGGSVRVILDLDAVGLIHEYGIQPDVAARFAGFTPDGFTSYKSDSQAEGYSYLLLTSDTRLVTTAPAAYLETTTVKILGDGSVEITVNQYMLPDYGTVIEFSADARLATTPDDPAGVYIYPR